eukprot:4390958-Alexandrium_andersonii.AAC.1
MAWEGSAELCRALECLEDSGWLPHSPEHSGRRQKYLAAPEEPGSTGGLQGDARGARPESG